MTISLEVYETVGAFKGAIDRDAEEILSAYPDEQATIQGLFQRITERGEGEKPIRKPETLPVLAEVIGVHLARLKQIVSSFAAQDLLVLREIYENGVAVTEVDLPHECLGWKWARLKSWIDEEAVLAKSLSFLLESVNKQQWLAGAALAEAVQLRDRGRLNGPWAHRYLSEADLTRLRQWAGESEKRYHAEQERVTKERRAWWTASIATFMALSLGGFASWSIKNGIVANTERDKAENAFAQSLVKDGKSLIEQRRPDEAAAIFARALQSSPQSVAGASWISDLLLNHNWWRPVLSLQHKGTVYLALFSPNGRRVVTASDDDTAQVWEADTGRPVGVPMRHKRAVYSAAFSPDGRRVVTASGDHTAQVWEADTGKPVGTPMQHKDIVYSAMFSPDGRRVVTASSDPTAQVWDADTGKPVGAPMRHKRAVFSAVFSPDGRRVVTASDDGTAQVWNSDSGKHVVTASEDNAARVWDAETGKPVGATMLHEGNVRSALFSPDGRRVVTASDDYTAQVWDADTGEPIGAPMQHNNPVLYAAFSPNGRRVVTASDDNTAQVWDADTARPVGGHIQHERAVYSAAFSLDGRRLVTASEDHTARVWDAGTGKPVGALMQHHGAVYFAVFSPDGRRVVTASEDHTAQVWEADTGKPVGARMQHKGIVYSAMFSPDGRGVVAASDDGTAQVWSADTGEPVGAPMRHKRAVLSAVFSPDSRRVVTASDDTTAQVWEAATGDPVGAPMLHNETIRSAVFSPDGRRVVTASYDATAQVWSVLIDCCDSQQRADRLAGLIEAVGGYEVTDAGSFSILDSAERRQRLRNLRDQTGTGHVQEGSVDWIIRRYSPAQ